MAPKKKEQQKMTLGEFLTDETMGSWADEMEDMPVSDSRTGYGTERRTYGASTGTYASGNSGGYHTREEPALPDKPPFTVHLGNLSFDATTSDIIDFFSGCGCTNVRIIEDRVDMKPKGFGYAEFSSREGIKQALTLNGTQLQGRSMRISIADSPKDRGDRSEVRELTDWSRKGPLPDLPIRSGMGSNRRDFDRGFAPENGAERRERFLESDNKIRDLGNWERKGPLSSISQPERLQREVDRSRMNDSSRLEGNLRDRRSSPAAWGDSRQQLSQEGSRPPRREFQDRSSADRPLTAAEQDNQWRSKMRPDAPAAKSPVASRDGSEAPSSPARSAAIATSRPKLNLAKRTVVDTNEHLMVSSSSDTRASPFGAAKPIDTAAKEREIEEKRLAAIKEKKEADEKLFAERREATKLPMETEDHKKTDIIPPIGANQIAMQEIPVNEITNGNNSDSKTIKTKEPIQNSQTITSETGAWRRPSNGPITTRDEIPKGPRAGRGKNGRGRYDERDGHRYNDGQQTQHNMNGSTTPESSRIDNAPDTVVKTLEEEGWSTVSKPKKSSRGGNQVSRVIAS